jgi:hypothetical protein
MPKQDTNYEATSAQPRVAAPQVPLTPIMDEEEPDGQEEPRLRRPHPFTGIGPLLPPLRLGGIPVGYDQERLALLVQAPDIVFCYWALRGRDDLLFGGEPVELRLYDETTHPSREVRRIPVDPNAGRWFVRSVPPDRRYRAALGVVRGENFVARLTSAQAQTPPSGPSNVRDSLFTRVTLPALPAPVAPQGQGRPSSAVLRAEHAERRGLRLESSTPPAEARALQVSSVERRYEVPEAATGLEILWATRVAPSSEVLPASAAQLQAWEAEGRAWLGSVLGVEPGEGAWAEVAHSPGRGW